MKDFQSHDFISRLPSLYWNSIKPGFRVKSNVEKRLKIQIMIFSSYQSYYEVKVPWNFREMTTLLMWWREWCVVTLFGVKRSRDKIRKLLRYDTILQNWRKRKQCNYLCQPKFIRNWVLRISVQNINYSHPLLFEITRTFVLEIESFSWYLKYWRKTFKSFVSA